MRYTRYHHKSIYIFRPEKKQHNTARKFIITNMKACVTQSGATTMKTNNIQTYGILQIKYDIRILCAVARFFSPTSRVHGNNKEIDAKKRKKSADNLLRSFWNRPGLTVIIIILIFLSFFRGAGFVSPDVTSSQRISGCYCYYGTVPFST